MQFSITPLGRVLHNQFFNLNHVANVAEYGFIDALDVKVHSSVSG